VLAIKNLKVEYGSRVAGHNGAGKSTLMKCIGSVIQPSSGEIAKPKHCNIGYLPQEGIHIKGITLWDETETAFAEAQALQNHIDKLSDQLVEMDSSTAEYMEALETIGDLELKLEHFDPSRIKPRIESILLGLGFTQKDFTRDCGEFYEPTNHLDIDSQAFVENYLKTYPGAIILISHDLALLDMLTTRTIAFSHGRAEEYAGNYSFYIRESKLRKEILLKQKKSQEKEIEKAKQFIDRFRAKASKATQAQSRLKQLEKIEIIEVEEDDAVMSFKFPDPPNSGHSVAKLEGACKVYGDKTIFKDLEIEVTKGERLAIVGPNGAGKSTFCRLITGQEEPDSGVFTLGHNAAVSFFSQNHADELDPDRTVLETVEASASRENAPLARGILGCFLFRGDDVFKKIGVLSGGERSRVALVSMLVQPANFLILDEPTNHLDVQSQEVLQRALQEYPGSYLIVSHNRSFLDPIVTKTLEFRPNQDPQLYHGNISYYLDKKEEEKNAAKNVAKATKQNNSKTQSSSNPGTKPGVKINRKEQRKLEAQMREKRSKVLKPLQQELAVLEEKIAEAEAAQAKVTEHLSLPEVSTDSAKMKKSSAELSTISNKLTKHYSTWEDITAKIEKVEAELES